MRRAKTVGAGESARRLPPLVHRKEAVFKELAGLLAGAGFDVRRERLRQGHGWKAVSGACRHENRKLLFVDRKLPQDEQIGFLASKAAELGIRVPEERARSIPRPWRDWLRGVVEDHGAAQP